MGKLDPEISVVLPIYNEEGNIAPLITEIEKALEPTSKNFEIICVDDASSDASVEKLYSLQKENPRIVIIRHCLNFGQSAAQASGFRYARGKIIATLDADGQNNPADFPRLLEYLEEYDCVCGMRKKRMDTGIRRFASRFANFIRNFLTGDNVVDSGCNLRVMYKSALVEVPIFNGTHRFIPSLLRAKGKKVLEVSVDHRPRNWGQSKYGIWDRALRGLVDCIALRWWKGRCFPSDRIVADVEHVHVHQ